MKLIILQRPGQFTTKDFQPELEKALRAVKGELGAYIRLDGFTRNGWARLDLEGEDSDVLRELLARDLGQAHTTAANLEAQGIYQGIVNGEDDNCLEIDIGIETPRPMNVKIGLAALRAQLGDGKPLRSNEIIHQYCLVPGIRTTVRLTRLEPATQTVEGWLADSQIERFSSLIATGLDRIQITDCFRQEVENAVKKSRIERDTVSIESETLTTQSLVCKLGTDAVGLIPKLGKILRNRKLDPFIPRRILTRCRPW
jgi:hypothetical protein